MSESNVTLTPLSFPSADGHSTVSACVWSASPIAELGKPKGAVQIVHGMCEHKERYDAFARALVAQGYVVCAHDQIGHGQTTPQEDWGYIPSQGGEDMLVEDVNSLRQLMQEQIPAGTPYFVFGHSMGSFVTRVYISRYGGGLAGAIICGTGFVPVNTSKAGHTMAQLIARVRGEKHKSKLLHSMADGAYAKAVENPLTDFDWLSYNQENVDRYIADPACGFPFTAGGYSTLTALTAECCTLECAQRVPASLPLFFIAGEEDPVGSNGQGVREAADLARKAGSTDVSAKLYPHMRHEILNETDHKKVFADVIDWLDQKGQTK